MDQLVWRGVDDPCSRGEVWRPSSCSISKSNVLIQGRIHLEQWRKQYIRLTIKMCKTKRDKTILQAELSSLKEVTLEGKWFGISGDQRSFLCVTQWTIGDGSLRHKKNTWKDLRRFRTCDIVGKLAVSCLCVVLASVTAQWGCQDRPTWCGWGRGNSLSWHAKRWIQRYSDQRALLDRRMCPRKLWMQSCNDLLSGYGFSYIQKIRPWTRRPYVWLMDW